MSWIIASLLMFLSSVVLYLFVRRSSLLKNPTQYNNLAMFLIPLLAFVLLGVTTHQNFIISFNQLIPIIGIAVVFSYLGNVFSLISIENAPNPGYSLVISKSYVVFTTVISVLFLHGEFSLRKIIAILIIILFSGLIMLSGKTSKKATNKKWLPLALGAFFCWGLLSLSSRYLFDQGINIYVYLSYMYFIVTLCIILDIMKNKIVFKTFHKNIPIFIGIGLFSAGFNLFQFEAIRTAPNVGYVNAINASSISAVTILAILMFHDEFSKRKLTGVLGVTFGLLLLLI